MIGGFVKLASSKLTGLLAGVPLDREAGEAQAVIMLSPGKRDTDIYIVALSFDGKERKIARICRKYTADELGSMLSGKMSAAGVDLGEMVQANLPSEDVTDEPLKEENV